MQMRVLCCTLLAGTTLLTACLAPLPPSAAQQSVQADNISPNPAQVEPAQQEAVPAAPSSNLSPEQQQLLATLPSRGVAPELFNETWLNSPPLTLAGLRGKVVLIKFWTFG